MTALLLLACITSFVAAWAGYIVGHRRGVIAGTRGLCNALIETLDRQQQFWTGANVLYLLRRMKGEKV